VLEREVKLLVGESGRIERRVADPAARSTQAKGDVPNGEIQSLFARLSHSAVEGRHTPQLIDGRFQ
jgi:hypothetical protein